nr:MAG TPA: hypothetical protein [Caudoviricetes sp.]
MYFLLSVIDMANRRSIATQSIFLITTLGVLYQTTNDINS